MGLLNDKIEKLGEVLDSAVNKSVSNEFLFCCVCEIYDIVKALVNERTNNETYTV